MDSRQRYWVYVIGPLAGAAIAVGCAWILRGRGGDPTSIAAGSGGLRQDATKLAHDIEHPSAAHRERQSETSEEDTGDSP